MENNIVVKECRECNKNKPSLEFDKDIKNKDKLSYYCKNCKRTNARQRRDKNREERLKPILNLEGEIWKDILNYIGYYQISNQGRVKTLQRTYKIWNYKAKDFIEIIKREKIIKSCIKEDGYWHLNLTKEKKEQSFLLHRVLAIAFILNPENLPEVHHKDHNRSNCKLDNLTWVTKDDNNRLAREAQRHGNRKYKTFITKEMRIKEPIPKYYTDTSFKPADERFKDIIGYEGHYQISNYGRVLSFKKGKIKFRKPKIHNKNPSGNHLNINLLKNGKAQSFGIHRLVAIHFSENLNNLPEVNHFDGNKHNNHINNLIWSTRLDNIRHAINTGLINNNGERSPLSKLTEKEVLEIRKLNKEGVSYYKLARMFNTRANNISAIVKRKTWKHLT